MHNLRQKGAEIKPEDVATSFQNSVVEVLVGKAVSACEAYDVKQLIIAGGVASNKGLRAALDKSCKQHEINLRIPSPKLCTDNAAMIGAAAHYLYQAGFVGDMSLNGFNDMDIEQFSINN